MSNAEAQLRLRPVDHPGRRSDPIEYGEEEDTVELRLNSSRPRTEVPMIPQQKVL